MLLLLVSHCEPADSQSVNTDIVNAYVAAKVPMWGLLDLACCMHWVQHLCATSHSYLCFMYMTVRHLVCTEALLHTVNHLELLFISHFERFGYSQISTACCSSWPCQTFVMCKVCHQKRGEQKCGNCVTYHGANGLYMSMRGVFEHLSEVSKSYNVNETINHNQW